MAKQLDAPYVPGKRKGMAKVKRERTIDCVVMGWRPGKEEGTVGSLILGLYDGDELRSVGHISGFSAAAKREHAGDAGAAGDGRARQRRAEPLDRRARPRVGGAAAGAGDRGGLRPCGQRADSARGAVSSRSGTTKRRRSAGSSNWTKGLRTEGCLGRRVLSGGISPVPGTAPCASRRTPASLPPPELRCSSSVAGSGPPRLLRVRPQPSTGAGRVFALGGLHVGAALVELLVAREEVGAFFLQPGEEDVLDLAAEVEGDAAEEGGAGLPGAFDDRADLLGAVVDARHQRRDQDAGVDAAAAQLGDGVEAGGGAGGVRLGRPPGLLVEGRHREVDRDRQPLAPSARRSRRRASPAATWSGPRPASPPPPAPRGSPASSGSGSRPTGTGRCSSPAPPAPASTPAAPAPPAAAPAR